MVSEPGPPDDFDSPDQLSSIPLAFADRCSQTARPFRRELTASDLHDLMHRLSNHYQQQDPQDEPLPRAA